MGIGLAANTENTDNTDFLSPFLAGGDETCKLYIDGGRVVMGGEERLALPFRRRG